MGDIAGAMARCVRFPRIIKCRAEGNWTESRKYINVQSTTKMKIARRQQALASHRTRNIPDAAAPDIPTQTRAGHLQWTPRNGKGVPAKAGEEKHQVRAGHLHSKKSSDNDIASTHQTTASKGAQDIRTPPPGIDDTSAQRRARKMSRLQPSRLNTCTRSAIHFPGGITRPGKIGGEKVRGIGTSIIHRRGGIERPLRGGRGKTQWRGNTRTTSAVHPRGGTDDERDNTIIPDADINATSKRAQRNTGRESSIRPPGGIMSPAKSGGGTM
ncbi:hypothetical protein C8R44DRAFT_853577 [Mycena epipterygia]|nr:hypothetical protein C8R44DRAFT_853577 [Mycena epipterygia]